MLIYDIISKEYHHGARGGSRVYPTSDIIGQLVREQGGPQAMRVQDFGPSDLAIDRPEDRELRRPSLEETERRRPRFENFGSEITPGERAAYYVGAPYRQVGEIRLDGVWPDDGSN